MLAALLHSKHCFMTAAAMPAHSLLTGNVVSGLLSPAAGFYSCKGSSQAHRMELVAAALRKEAANPADPCEGKPDAESCDALDECTWCKAAAVPSSCFTVVGVNLIGKAVSGQQTLSSVQSSLVQRRISSRLLCRALFCGGRKGRGAQCNDKHSAAWVADSLTVYTHCCLTGGGAAHLAML